MDGSVSDVVPLVWMLFPLQPGYVMTVWADASEKLATTSASSVKRNMVADRCKQCGRGAEVLLFCDAAVCVVVHSQVVVDAKRQGAVAGDISTYGAHDLALRASCNHAVLPSRLAAADGAWQANEDSKTAPRERPASACQLSKH
jgi:hypothetical protein